MIFSEFKLASVNYIVFFEKLNQPGRNNLFEDFRYNGKQQYWPVIA